MLVPKSFTIVMFITIICVLSFATWSYTHNSSSSPPSPSPTPSPPSSSHNEPENTDPQLPGTVTVGSQRFSFDPSSVQTTRPDLFDPGFFSMFDVLVHLDSQEKIDMQYHFDESMNTHIIDSINGEPTWWYQAYYSGGWPENNVFRPDHYPWKDGTTLRFYQLESPSRLDNIYTVWKEEVTQRKNHEGKLLIPKVIINGRSFSKTFENVEVTPHNLRTDVFQENVTTAIDVILSLGDQGHITYELQWYETIGSASIVKNYWVDGINGDHTFGRCGFVYEAGAPQFDFFQGNHIHLPADTRILNSPEYVEFFWICV